MRTVDRETRRAADTGCGQEAERHPRQSIHPKECLRGARSTREKNERVGSRDKNLSGRKKWEDGRKKEKRRQKVRESREMTTRDRKKSEVRSGRK